MNDVVITLVRTRPAKICEGCVQCLLFDFDNCAEIEQAFGLPDCTDGDRFLIHLKDDKV